jgi:hypothetical protein
MLHLKHRKDRIFRVRNWLILAMNLLSNQVFCAGQYADVEKEKRILSPVG